MNVTNSYFFVKILITFFYFISGTPRLLKRHIQHIIRALLTRRVCC